MKLIICIVIVFTIFLNAPLIGAENTPTELSIQLKQMAKELESNEHGDVKSFIKKYALSEHLQKLMTEEKLDGIVERFIEKKKQKLSKHLIAASQMSPVISEDKMTYTFDHNNDSTNTMTKKLLLVYSTKTKLFHIKN